MKSIWKRKWVVIPVAVAIILAIGALGAVALADPGDGNGTAAPSRIAAATTGVQSPTGAQPGQTLRERLRVRLQDRLARLKARWAQARERMSPEDQAAFDKLQQTAKDQQAALQQARQDLRSTLQQMRDLVQKYPPPAAN